MQLVKAVVLIAFCAAVVVPFVGIISTSVAPESQIADAGGFVLFPEEVHLSAYTAILTGGVVTRALGVSIGVTVVGTAISLAVSTMLAYALSRTEVVLMKPFLLLLLFSMLFSAGLIPNYLMVKELGLLDTYWALILPTALSAFNTIVLRNFFMNIPAELLESARIDGAGHLRIFLTIVLPLSKAVLAVIGLFYAVGYWNNFFHALMYLNDSSMWPMQLVLRTYVVDNTTMGAGELGEAAAEAIPPAQSIQMATLIIAMVPILIVYPFLQKHFAKGVLAGAVKG